MSYHLLLKELDTSLLFLLMTPNFPFLEERIAFTFFLLHWRVGMYVRILKEFCSSQVASCSKEFELSVLYQGRELKRFALSRQQSLYCCPPTLVYNFTAEELRILIN